MSDMSILPGKGVQSFSLFETVLARPEPQLVGRVLKYSERPGVVALRLRLVSSSFAYRDSFVMEMNRYVYLRLRDKTSFDEIQKSFLWRHLDSFSLYRPNYFVSPNEVTIMNLVNALNLSRPGITIHSLRFRDFLGLTPLITEMTDSDLLSCFAHVKTLELGRLGIQPVDSHESLEAFKRLLKSCSSLTELVLEPDSRYPKDLKELLDEITGDDFHRIFGPLKKLRFRQAFCFDIGLDLRRFLRVFPVGESLEGIKTWPFAQKYMSQLSDDELIQIFGHLKEISNELFMDPSNEETFVRLLKAVLSPETLELRNAPLMLMNRLLTDEDMSCFFGSLKVLILNQTNIDEVSLQRIFAVAPQLVVCNRSEGVGLVSLYRKQE